MVDTNSVNPLALRWSVTEKHNGIGAQLAVACGYSLLFRWFRASWGIPRFSVGIKKRAPICGESKIAALKLLRKVKRAGAILKVTVRLVTPCARGLDRRRGGSDGGRLREVAKKNATRGWHFSDLLRALGTHERRSLVSAHLVSQLDTEQSWHGGASGLSEVLIFTVAQYLQYSNVV